MTSSNDPVEAFLARSIARPDWPAVVESGEVVSYATMEDRVRRLAARLTQFGPHPRVLIHLPQGSWAYAAMFASLMAGGYYAPVNVGAPAIRRRAVLDRFDPDVVISDKANHSELGSSLGANQIVCITDIGSHSLRAAVSPHEIAYVIFTSGTTGAPKGVVIARSSLEHYVGWAMSAMEIRPEDRWSQHPNIGFDLSVLDIYGALCSGATLYPLCSRSERLQPAEFIRRQRLTIWNSVPSVVDLMRRGRATPAHFDSLRLLTFCGEPLTRDHLEFVFSLNSGVVVHNTYGPTEATVSCTLLRLTRDGYAKLTKPSVPLGQPISGMNLMLMDGSGPDDGEIVLSGPQVAIGYWNDRAATDRRFVEVDVRGRKTIGYRTGDRAIRNGEHLFFVARLDRQVKIRGNRVELGEIEAVVRAATSLPVAVVFENDALHAVLECDELPDVAKLRRDLAEQLPPHGIPERFHRMPELPVGLNEKIDYACLAELVRNESA